jgi:hypothetical protein
MRPGRCWLKGALLRPSPSPRHLNTTPQSRESRSILPTWLRDLIDVLFIAGMLLTLALLRAHLP